MSSLRERPIEILPGQYFDAETGLHQNRFRDYDPSIGRYLQSDPIGLQGGINTYGYARQNPARYIDPLGLCSCRAVSKNDDHHDERWWGQIRTVTCTYKCTKDDGTSEDVRATHTEWYLQGGMSDYGYEGDCIGAYFGATSVDPNTFRTVSRRTSYEAFDPADSPSDTLKQWASKPCNCGK